MPIASAFYVRWFLLLCSLLIFGNLASCQRAANTGIPNLEEVFAWKQITYNFGQQSGLTDRYGFSGFRNEKHIFQATSSTAAPPEPSQDSEVSDETAFFIQYNNVPMGVSRWKDRLFVTLPRRRYGIPATLNYLSLTEDTNTKSPGLRPYPDLYTNAYMDRTRSGQDSPLVSVYRTDVDSCDRLWMVDNGLLEVPNANQLLQPPAIVIIDLNTNRILRRFELPQDVIIFNSTEGLASITVDVDASDCNNAHAYVTDLAQYGMIVYSLRKNNAWRVSHISFHMDPQAGDYMVNGLRFQWTDGVFSIALTPRQPDGNKMAIFHAMSGTKEYAVSTNVLQNETLAARSNHGDDFRLLGDRGRNTQTASHDLYEPTGVVFYGQVVRNAIVCWNTATPFTEASHVTLARDDTLLQYPASLFIDSQGEGWVMSNRLPTYNYASLNPNETNYRIYRFHAPTIIAGTACAGSASAFNLQNSRPRRRYS